MTLRTGLIITGDTAGAQKSLADLAGGMERAEGAARGLGAAEQVVGGSTEALGAELLQAKLAAEALGTELLQAREAAAAMAGRVDILESKLAAAAGAGRANVASMGQQAQGARMLGQQFQDMGIMAAMGITSTSDVLRILAMQGGQTALALEQMGVKGAAGRVVGFLGSPWGSAIMAATMILTPFIGQIFAANDELATTSDNLDKAAQSADSFGNAQSLLGKIIDLNTGKLKTQNKTLVETIRLQANAMLLSGQEAEGKAREKIGSVGDPTWFQSFGIAAAGAGGGGVAQTMNAGLRALREKVLAGGMDATDIRKSVDALAKAGDLADHSTAQIIDLKRELLTLPQALNDQKAAQQALDAIDGKGIAPELKPYSSGSKPRAARSTASRDEFGRDTADRIASIAASFDDTPSQIQRAGKAIRQLDDVIDDLSRKKPPNFQGLIESAHAAKLVVEGGLVRSLTDAFKLPETLSDKAAVALGSLDTLVAQKAAKLKDGLIDQGAFDAFRKQVEGARDVIETGLAQPYDEFVQAQENALQIQNLIAQGRHDEAEALRITLQLEKSMGTLSDARKEAVLATVQGLRAAQRETDVLRDKNRKYVDALGSIRGAVEDASQAFARGELGQFIKTPGRLLDAFMSLQGDKLFERIFGDLFRDLEDEVNGTSVVKDAGERMASAVDKASSSLGQLEAAAKGAASAMNGQGWAGGVQGTSGALGIDALFGGDAEAAIEVLGRKTSSKGDVFSLAIGGAVEKFSDIFTSPENAKALGTNIGKFAGKGLEGAATGSFVAGISNSLGLKMNSTGAQIGGAVGSFLPIPGGQIIGAIAGGLLGGLLQKPKYGTAIMTSATDKVSASGRGDSMIGAASGLGSSVQSGLRQIADMLGGTLGAFDTVVGTFNGKYRVRTTASGWDGKGPLDFKGNSANNLHDFGDDQAAALNFAIMDAIKDGAVTGLSAAVQKAIGSSDDIDRSLKEAQKVASVEQMLGGLPTEIANAFRNFEAEAKERLRIARQYGFDVVEIEKLNAKQRLALTDQLMANQVGSLQRLVDEMTHGALFAGSSGDQRAALLDAIQAAKADMDAGVDGSGDKLAGLYEKLNAVSEEYYGSTSGYAADRTAILDEARAGIAKANAQIQAAQAKASDPALSTTNAALDENNDQNARMIEALERNNGLLARIAAGNLSGADLASLARTS